MNNRMSLISKYDLTTALSMSKNINDRFVCVKGDYVGRVLFWDKSNKDMLSVKFDSGEVMPTSIGFSKDSRNEWIIVRGDE